MCGVIGGWTKTQNGADAISRVLLQSKIRGLHATGISSLREGKIETIKLPISADKFISMHPIQLYDSSLSMVAHCRYSTSDLDWNQPLSSENGSIVHNGVVDQSDPNCWKEKYEIEFSGRNDSEILFRLFEMGSEWWKILQHTSIAMCHLSCNGRISFYRNGKRPLHMHRSDDIGLIVASTGDIFRRSELTSVECQPGVLYQYDGVSLTEQKLIDIGKDLQKC